MVGQEDENMLWQNEEDEEEGGEDKSPNREEDVPDEDIVGVLVGPAQARNSVVRKILLLQCLSIIFLPTGWDVNNCNHFPDSECCPGSRPAQLSKSL